ncbi:hypothetical protein [Streptomyces tremellae]|uniref:hypothetical protein n=1 Tax=Streptomyces tremellae TaxID=1124239 RepID=UPI0031E58B96
MPRPAVPRTPALIPALALGGAWWWAVVRLVLAPERTGAVERVVVAGGWGLSLLPVHVASRSAPAERAERERRRRDRARAPGEPGFEMPYTPYEGGYGYGPADYGGYAAPEGEAYGYGPRQYGCGPGRPYGAEPYPYGPGAWAPGAPPYGPGPGASGEPPYEAGPDEPYPYPYESPGPYDAPGDPEDGGEHGPPGAR